MSGKFKYKAGAGHAEKFKVSGKPYLKRGLFASGVAANSEQGILFPSVAKSILIHNEASNENSFALRVSFASNSDSDVSSSLNGTGSSAVLTPGESLSIDGRCSSLFVSTDLSPGVDCYYLVTAELTGVTEYYNLSGSGIDE